MGTAALVLFGTVASYAINTRKIREIAHGRQVYAIVLEGFQAAGFLLVIAKIASSPGGWAGIGSYIIGAMVGTAVAMRSTHHSQTHLVATARVTPDKSCGLLTKPCPWCGGTPDAILEVAILFRDSSEEAYGYRCPKCDRCVLRPGEDREVGS